MMGSLVKEDLSVAFDEVEDPRVERTKKYPIQEIIFLVLVVALMGVESWRGASLVGNERIDFLRRFFSYKNGIPSHQTEDLLENLNDWVGLKSVGKVETTTFKNGKEFFETRLYLLSYLSAKVFADAARGHWGIENKLHWSLDVVYKEDASRKRTDFAPRNYSLIRKFALNISKSFKGKLSVPLFHTKNSLNLDFFQDILVKSGFKLLSN